MLSALNMSIGRKLGAGFACILVAVALMNATLFFLLRAAEHATLASAAIAKTASSLDHSLLAAAEESRASYGYLIAREEGFLHAYNAAVTDFGNRIESARKDAAAYPGILKCIDKVASAEALYRRDIGDVIIRLAHDSPASAQAMEFAKSDRTQNLFASLQRAADETRENIAAASADAQKTQDLLIGLAHLASVGGGLTTLLLAVFIGVWLTRSIARPVTEMTGVMKKIADGDVTVSVPGVGRKDELGHMAEAVQFFKEQSIKRIQKKAQEEEDIKRWQAEDAERLAQEKEAARQDQMAIDHLASGLAKLADGNLAYRIDTIFAPKTEKLRTDFNSAVEKLQQTMQSLRANIDAIHVGSGEISSAADDLSRRTEQQAASLEETAATLDQITATVKNTAQGAVHAREVVSEAKTNADESGEVVRRAIDAMGGIETSSRQISQIIGVIDEIAFQTNLLALNAGVEAARAGDAGRGFAVVASEVRALAQRSAEAAKEIKGLISASTAQVVQGVDLVGATGKALERIVAQVAEIDTVVSRIAVSAQEQAAALHQVNTALNQMDQVTQQNAAMVEETTAAAHMLNKESDELARLVGRFQTGHAASESGEMAREASRSAQPFRPAVKMHAIQKQGSTLRKLKPAPAEESQQENWEEF
jgi:methyl-accepting chemotaxis protein